MTFYDCNKFSVEMMILKYFLRNWKITKAVTNAVVPCYKRRLCSKMFHRRLKPR